MSCILGKLSWEYSSRIREISTCFLGHSRTMRDLKTSSRKWSLGLLCVLNPSTTFLICDFAWSGNLPLLSNSSSSSGHPHTAGIQVTVVDLQGGSRGQARGFAADPGDSSNTSKENVIYTTSPGKTDPLDLMEVKTLWGSAAAIFRRH